MPAFAGMTSGKKREYFLPAQAETFDQRLVAIAILGLEVAEQATTLVDHLEQAATRMMILGVIGEMFAEVFDASGQQRNLDFGRTGVVGNATVVGDDLAGLFVGERHLNEILEAKARLANDHPAMGGGNGLKEPIDAPIP